ncbi:MAG TPA: hypothetical protein VFY14_07240 [Streptomyces sp.]|nr:hypothetical protein [Streptomyces sp.]
MTSRTRTTEQAKQTAARKTAAKKTTAKKTAARPARKTAEKTTPRLSLVKPVDLRAGLPTRTRDYMTDTQGHATLAALTAGIPTPRIRDWRDHHNGTATRPLADGSHLHYTLATRTLTWQAECPMGAVHAYRLDSPSAATWARIHVTRCQTAHADLSAVPALTPDELAGYGILHTADRPTLPGDDPVTETIPIPLPTAEPEPRTLADTLAHSNTSTADTQPLPILPADTETSKEHPQP